MKNSKVHNHMRTFAFSLISLLFLILAGCSQSPKPDPGQVFFDKWQKVAEESQGYSPEQDVEVNDLGEEIFESMTIQEDQGPGGSSDRPLPTQPVSMNLQNSTPIQTVLRLLSKGVDQNLVISPQVQGDVQINLQD